MSNLNNHVETVHEGKKRFNCDICNAEFGQKSYLNIHVAAVHEGKKPRTEYIGILYEH